MKTIPATEAKNNLGQFLDDSQNEPVMITRNGKKFAVLVSHADFKRLTEGGSVRPLVKELHKRSIERRRKVYEALAK